MAEFEKYYTVAEVCDILHKTSRTIYFYIKSGQLKATKPGKKRFLISETALKEFIAAGVQPGSFQATYPRPHKRDKVIPKE